jgi:uncharacterized membrane protein YeaQ/YmgE (transglycosylase-associated protein family)
MGILILLVAMVLVGLVIGWVAGLIWKDNRPIGVRGDYIASVITTVIVGLLDWFVIPAMGIESVAIKYLGVALEPPLAALIVLWVIRKANR